MSFFRQFLQHGTTVLHYDHDAQSVVPVFLKLEKCNGTVTWCRPPWADPRKVGGNGMGNGIGGAAVGGGAGGAQAGGGGGGGLGAGSGNGANGGGSPGVSG